MEDTSSDVSRPSGSWALQRRVSAGAKAMADAVADPSYSIRLRQLQLRSDLMIGQWRMRLPQAAKIALQTAGITTG